MTSPRIPVGRAPTHVEPPPQPSLKHSDPYRTAQVLADFFGEGHRLRWVFVLLVVSVLSWLARGVLPAWLSCC